MPDKDIAVFPAKQFFVQMMTRDIGLEEAVLDLLDNCIDGLLRSTKEISGPQPYNGFYAEIYADSDRFIIQDNCGGIPRQIARESAFRLGRPDLSRDSDLKTVGMYGIGMKRAIFKMGRNAEVYSRPDGDTYQVKIDPQWMDTDDDWQLSLEEAEASIRSQGTKIYVDHLYETIQHQFDEGKSNFLNELKDEISRFYAIIIKKGFRISLNNAEISPKDVSLRVADPESVNSIRPYIWRGEINGVATHIAVGFFRPLAKEEELDTERDVSTKHTGAGWTIICNDRVILHNDRSALTGWGRGNVPTYHSQFRSIAGVVVFSSNDSYALPLNTRKRGIDAASPVYIRALDIMMDGMKRFTDFTNQWKGAEREANKLFRNTNEQSAVQVASQYASEKASKSRKWGGEVFRVELPRPETNRNYRRISFRRQVDEISAVAENLFDESDVHPSRVGEECFERQLARAKNTTSN